MKDYARRKAGLPRTLAFILNIIWLNLLDSALAVTGREVRGKG
jgi:hypothetical protein